MLLSTQTDYMVQRFGDVEAVKVLAANGFDCIDYSMFIMSNPKCPLNIGDDYIAHAKKLRKTADECGISFNQSHAPFSSYIKGNDEYNVFIRKAIKRSIEISGILGAKVCVVHPACVRGNDELQKELNMELYRDLEPVCAANGVKAALENMWDYSDEIKHIVPAACGTAQQFNEYLDELGYEHFTACLDLGHCGISLQNCADMIREMGGKRITALHVHDNDNIHDSHTLPFTMSMDWNAITAALRDIGYSGDFTFEADNFIARFPGETVIDASRLMERTGRKLIQMIEG